MATLHVICDSTELALTPEAEIPDTVILGGYSLRDSALLSLVSNVRTIKQNVLGHSYAPIKWNVRDLDRALALHGLTNLRPRLIERSDEVRSALIRALVDANATVFLSVLVAYSNRRQVLGRTRDDIIRYSFSNFLMRAGLHWADNNSPTEVEIILDWPASDKRNIFIKEYHTGWKTGESRTDGRTVPYWCGPLRDLRFNPSLLFGVTDLDERLQLADLVVGAGRAFINFCAGRGTRDDFGVQQFVALEQRADRRGSQSCFGRGLTVSPSTSPFATTVLNCLNELVC